MHKILLQICCVSYFCCVFFIVLLWFYPKKVQWKFLYSVLTHTHTLKTCTICGYKLPRFHCMLCICIFRLLITVIMEKGEEESVAKTMTIKVEQNQEENQYLFIYGNFMPYGEKHISSLISPDPSIQSNRLIYILLIVNSQKNCTIAIVHWFNSKFECNC